LSEQKPENGTIRVDKWLWQARFFKSRTLAGKLSAGRKIRVNRQIVNKASANVKAGDVLTFPQGDSIRVIEIVALGARRGPAAEAQALYKDLAPPQPRAKQDDADLAPGAISPGKRPTKKQRRDITRLKSRDPA
jgi:ribosome-associated heat shock protein Hsp15